MDGTENFANLDGRAVARYRCSDLFSRPPQVSGVETLPAMWIAFVYETLPSSASTVRSARESTSVKGVETC
jgi:hypothetical protein